MEASLMDIVLDYEVAPIMDELRADEELEYQAEDENAIWEYNNYWAGIAADEYGKGFVEYERACADSEQRYTEEYEYTQEEEEAMYEQYCLEQMEEEAWYREQERAWYATHPEEEAQ